MAKKLNNQYELDIIQMFFEENLSLQAVRPPNLFVGI